MKANMMADQRYTTDQLRKAIDSGRSGAKIDYPDPAAAPLGTDDEAGGASPSPEAVRQAYHHEVHGSPVETKGNQLERGAYIYMAVMTALIVALISIAIWMAS
jgi:hypothetical protein